MAIESPWQGVVNADTGEYYAGAPGPGVGNDPVFAKVVDDVWTVATDDDDVTQGDFRKIVLQGTSSRKTTRESA